MAYTQLQKAQNMLSGYLNNMVWLTSDQCSLEGKEKETTTRNIQAKIDEWENKVNILKA